MLKGISVTLTVKTESGTDAFNRPIVTESTVTVENVLVCPASSGNSLDSTSLDGKSAGYTLCIPKGDTHVWKDTTVEFFSQKWKTIGEPKEYIEDMLPLSWNKQVSVERYE